MILHYNIMQDYDKEHKPFEIKQINGEEYDIFVDQVIINVKTNVETQVVKYTNSYLKIASLGLFERKSDQYFVSIPVHMIMDFLNK